MANSQAKPGGIPCMIELDRDGAWIHCARPAGHDGQHWANLGGLAGEVQWDGPIGWSGIGRTQLPADEPAGKEQPEPRKRRKKGEVRSDAEI